MRTDPRIEAHGFTQSPLGQAASEVDRLRGQVAHLQDALETIERTVGFVPRNEPLSVWVERAVKERDHARAACAEMRKALEPFACETCNGTHEFTFECPGCLSGEAECTCKYMKPEPCPQCQSCDGMKKIYGDREHALSTDCGKGWLSPEVGKELVEALESAANALNEVVAYSSCDCDIPNGKTCPACQCAMATEQARKALSLAKEAGL